MSARATAGLASSRLLRAVLCLTVTAALMCGALLWWVDIRWGGSVPLAAAGLQQYLEEATGRPPPIQSCVLQTGIWVAHDQDTHECQVIATVQDIATAQHTTCDVDAGVQVVKEAPIAAEEQSAIPVIVWRRSTPHVGQFYHETEHFLWLAALMVDAGVLRPDGFQVAQPQVVLIDDAANPTPLFLPLLEALTSRPLLRCRSCYDSTNCKQPPHSALTLTRWKAQASIGTSRCAEVPWHADLRQPYQPCMMAAVNAFRQRTMSHLFGPDWAQLVPFENRTITFIHRPLLSKGIFDGVPALNSRSILNSVQLEHISSIAGHPFRLLDPTGLTLKEQLAVIQSTLVFVGVHGAGLALALYLPPESALVELHSASYDVYSLYTNYAVLGGTLVRPLEFSQCDDLIHLSTTADPRKDAPIILNIPALTRHVEATVQELTDAHLRNRPTPAARPAATG